MQTAGGATLSEDTQPEADAGPGPDDTTSDKPRRRPGLTLAALLIAAFAVGLDQWTKYLAEANLDPHEPVRILGGLVYLSLTWNSGAAFSLGTGYTWIFTIVASAVVVFLVFLSRRIAYPMWAVAIGLVLGGAAGNLVDRYFREPGFAHGHVVDFISAFKPFGEAFPIFNIADSALCCGVVLIVLLELTGHGFSPESRRPQRESEEAEAA
ncbi:signal peptidase II [Glycomyces scopariae]|uniref:Lipoprotein signal peptidase n=1 Tax=Glycomyces sambucus TaxID=380244 RepID=A0A1G9DMN0_9ACTN|nr:signal peptidase II [Glycomyces sambucus]SDK65156.1 signal peptidase II [Glycomyces sambucus]